MSNDKNKSERRRLNLLATKKFDDSHPYPYGTVVVKDKIMVNHEGGMAFDNPDLQRLIKDGMVYVPLCRGTPPKKFNTEFKKFFRWGIFYGEYRGISISGQAPRTFLYVTEKGKNWFNKNWNKYND